MTIMVLPGTFGLQSCPANACRNHKTDRPPAAPFGNSGFTDRSGVPSILNTCSNVNPLRNAWLTSRLHTSHHLVARRRGLSLVDLVNDGEQAWASRPRSMRSPSRNQVVRSLFGQRPISPKNNNFDGDQVSHAHKWAQLCNIFCCLWGQLQFSPSRSAAWIFRPTGFVGRIHRWRARTFCMLAVLWLGCFAGDGTTVSHTR